MRSSLVLSLVLLALAGPAFSQLSPEKLQTVLKKYPQADANGDGILTMEEALAFRDKMKASPARETSPTPDPNRPTPTLTGLYAEGSSCLFDFWKARTATPAPLVIYIHGGGFVGGSREQLASATIKEALDRGFAIMTIDYPFLDREPIQKIMRSCARAVQYARHEAAKLKIDSGHIACFGGSGGAGASLWIGTHPDLADPNSPDPVARESSRIQAVGMIKGQSTYDLLRWAELIGPAKSDLTKGPDEVMNFYHFKNQEDLTSLAGAAIRADVDMYGLLDKNSPPLFVYCDTVLKPELSRGNYLHHPKHSEVIAEKARSLGLPVKSLIGADAKGKNANLEALDFFATQFGLPPQTP